MPICKTLGTTNRTQNRKMLNVYNKLIVSAIHTTSNSDNRDIWKYLTLMAISLPLTFNIVTIWLIIETHFYPGFTSFMKIEIIPVFKYNVLLNFVLYLFLPIFIFNGIYIFRKQHYLSLMENYSNAHNKKLSGLYFGISWVVFFGYWIYTM